MSGEDDRESLRGYRPTVYVEGARVDSVPDAPALAPGIAPIGVTYDLALAGASAGDDDGQCARFALDSTIAVDRRPEDLLAKLEAVRRQCADVRSQ
jgi:4-hydroxybutyryl-CoA dehydratase / vinylacetyl-CoA-Delta-isomerase